MTPCTVWTRAPAQPMAPLGEVHVWRVDLDAADRSPAMLALLCSDEERDRARDMRDPRARDRFVSRRALHRVLLGGYAVGNHRLELHTVTAHLGSDALFAFGRTAGLGLSIVPVPEHDPTLCRLPAVTNRERLALRRAPPSERAWTAAALLAAKEALGHARGRGLDAAVGEIELLELVEPVAKGGTFFAEVDGLPWSGTILALAADRAACVVHDGGPRALRAWAVGA